MSGATMLPAGSVVFCIAGHDKGRFYAVVKWQGDRAFIADGRARKLARPKPKNPIHLRKTNRLLDLDAVDTDKKLRLALGPLNEGAGVAPTDQEGGKRLV